MPLQGTARPCCTSLREPARDVGCNATFQHTKLVYRPFSLVQAEWAAHSAQVCEHENADLHSLQNG